MLEKLHGEYCNSDKSSTWSVRMVVNKLGQRERKKGSNTEPEEGEWKLIWFTVEKKKGKASKDESTNMKREGFGQSTEGEEAVRKVSAQALMWKRKK